MPQNDAATLIGRAPRLHTLVLPVTGRATTTSRGSGAPSRSGCSASAIEAGDGLLRLAIARPGASEPLGQVDVHLTVTD